MYRILVAGCGYVGTRIGTHFRARNQKVWGITRTSERRDALQKIGITPLVADLTNPESLSIIPDNIHFLIICPSPDSRDETAYRNVYLDGIGNLIRQVQKNSRPIFTIHLSSTGVYGERGGDWVTEETSPQPDSERGKILLEAERQVLNSGLISCVFRLAGIYGPGRNRIALIREKKFLNDSNDKFVNLIHVDDIVKAIPFLFNSADAGQIYLGVDDEPVKRSEYYEWISEKLGVEYPKIIHPKQISGKRCQNAKLENLGFTFQYPTFREGYTTLISQEASSPKSLIGDLRFPLSQE